jgi:hypothetical protein
MLSSCDHEGGAEMMMNEPTHMTGLDARGRGDVFFEDERVCGGEDKRSCQSRRVDWTD